MMNHLLTIKQSHLGDSVICQGCIKKGQRILLAKHLKKSDRNQFSFEIDSERHAQLEDFARMMNHSCHPNVRINKLDNCFEFVALKDIVEGDELCWDYETNESILNVPFKCQCGSSDCRSQIIGFSHQPHVDWIKISEKSLYRNYTIDLFDSTVMNEYQKFTLARLAYKICINSYETMPFSYFMNTLFPIESVSDKIFFIKDEEQYRGFISVHLFKLNLNNKNTYIIMSEVVVDPQLEKKPSIVKIMVKAIMLFRLKFFIGEMYIVDTIVTPFFFNTILKAASMVYPSPHLKFPKAYHLTIDKLAKIYDWEMSYSQGVAVRTLGKWKYKNQDKLLLNRSQRFESEYTDFYTAHCPDYSEGRGIVIFIPVTFLNLIKSVVQIGQHLKKIAMA